MRAGSPPRPLPADEWEGPPAGTSPTLQEEWDAREEAARKVFAAKPDANNQGGSMGGEDTFRGMVDIPPRAHGAGRTARLMG
eukprot:gene1174-217_t